MKPLLIFTFLNLFTSALHAQGQPNHFVNVDSAFINHPQLTLVIAQLESLQDFWKRKKDSVCEVMSRYCDTFDDTWSNKKIKRFNDSLQKLNDIEIQIDVEQVNALSSMDDSLFSGLYDDVIETAKKIANEEGFAIDFLNDSLCTLQKDMRLDITDQVIKRLMQKHKMTTLPDKGGLNRHSGGLVEFEAKGCYFPPRKKKKR